MDRGNLAGRVEKLLEECDVVSFDLFDTLIKRETGKPENVFALMEAYLKSEEDPEAEHFHDRRIRAMQAVYGEKNIEEVRLEDIYRQMYKGDPEAGRKLMNVEMQTEAAVCVKNQPVCEVLDQCFKKGKRLLVITDTYLPEPLIWEILRKNGLARYFEEKAVYVSSEILKTKKSGSLYRYILKREHLLPGKWLHIGDARRSDYLVPKMLGIHAVHIQRETDNCMFHGRIAGAEEKKAYALLETCQSVRSADCSGYYERFGYECLGPVVYGFCSWLKERIEGKKGSKIWFLAREGQFLKRAYECAGGRQDSEYFYTSRQSIGKTTFWLEDSIGHILRDVRFPHRFDRKVLLGLLGLPFGSCPEKDTVYRSAADVMADVEMRGWLEGHLDEIRSRSRSQYEMFLSYMDLEASCREIVLVDVGWRGTMQDALERVLLAAGRDIDVNGYYIGINSAAAQSSGHGTKEGYLFDKGKSGDFIDENELFGFGGLFETLFMADHGSVMAYERREGKVAPVLHECEYTKDYIKIKEIQNGALRYIRDASDSMAHRYLIGNMPAVMSAKMREAGNRPKQREIRMLGGIRILDGAVRTLVGTPSWRAPGSVGTELMNSGWKTAALKKLCPLLPAGQIYKMIRRKGKE